MKIWKRMSWATLGSQWKIHTQETPVCQNLTALWPESHVMLIKRPNYTNQNLSKVFSPGTSMDWKLNLVFFGDSARTKPIDKWLEFLKLFLWAHSLCSPAMQSSHGSCLQQCKNENAPQAYPPSSICFCHILMLYDSACFLLVCLICSFAYSG